MIRYALACRDGHAFEAWFRDSAAYEAQRAAGLVACAVCGGGEVEKAVMAPGLARAAGDRGEERRNRALSAPADSGPALALAELRRKLEAEADYVGPRFAEEARRLHGEGEPARPIWGEATLGEARALLADGVPVAPLPHLPRRDD